MLLFASCKERLCKPYIEKLKSPSCGVCTAHWQIGADTSDIIHYAAKVEK